MDLDTLIRQSDPARSVPTVEADSPEAVLLYKQIVAGNDRPARRPATDPRRRRSTVALVLMAVAALGLGTAAIAVSSGGVSRSHNSPLSRAAVLLDSAADAATGQSALPALGPGQYFYEKTLLSGLCAPYSASGHINQSTGAPLDPNLASVVYRQSVTFESWSAPDGSGTNHETYTGHFETDQDQARWEASGAPNDCALPAQPVTMIPPRSSEDPGISMLPSDPTAVAALIAAGRVDDAGRVLPSRGRCPSQAGSSNQVFVNGEVCNVAAQFDIVNNLLQNPGAPIKLGPVLYKVMAQLPSVKIIGNQIDAIGRTGTAIEEPNSGNVFVIDTSSGTLLETETIATPQSLSSGETASDIAPGTVLATTTYATFGVTNALGTPPG